MRNLLCVYCLSPGTEETERPCVREHRQLPSGVACGSSVPGVVVALEASLLLCDSVCCLWGSSRLLSRVLWVLSKAVQCPAVTYCRPRSGCALCPVRRSLERSKQCVLCLSPMKNPDFVFSFPHSPLSRQQNEKESGPPRKEARFLCLQADGQRDEG